MRMERAWWSEYDQNRAFKTLKVDKKYDKMKGSLRNWSTYPDILSKSPYDNENGDTTEWQSVQTEIQMFLHKLYRLMITKQIM